MNKEMKKNRWLFACCMLVLGAFVLGLLGILSPVAAERPGQEMAGRLAGVLITQEYLDLGSGVETYWENDPQALLAGATGETVMHEDGRLYAERRTEVWVDSETGEESRHDVYAFKDLKGILFYHAIFDGEEGSEPYEATECDDAVADVTTHISVTDEGESVEIEGTLYMTGAGAYRTLYMNPVWQTDDGRLYVTSGNSFLHGGAGLEESSWSTTLSEKTTVSSQDETKTRELTIKINVRSIREPVGVTILSFDEQSLCIGRESCETDALPETIEVPAKTCWLVAETMTHAADGTVQAARTLCEPSGSSWEESYVELYQIREDGYAVKQQIPIVSSGQE